MLLKKKEACLLMGDAEIRDDAMRRVAHKPTRFPTRLQGGSPIPREGVSVQAGLEATSRNETQSKGLQMPTN